MPRESLTLILSLLFSCGSPHIKFLAILRATLLDAKLQFLDKRANQPDLINRASYVLLPVCECAYRPDRHLTGLVEDD